MTGFRWGTALRSFGQGLVAASAITSGIWEAWSQSQSRLLLFTPLSLSDAEFWSTSLQLHSIAYRLSAENLACTHSLPKTEVPTSIICPAYPCLSSYPGPKSSLYHPFQLPLFSSTRLGANHISIASTTSPSARSPFSDFTCCSAACQVIPIAS